MSGTSTDWIERGACRGKTEVFFPAGSEDDERVGEAAAKRICATCPVISDCMDDSLPALVGGSPPEYDLYGVFAGLNRWERMWFSEFAHNGARDRLDDAREAVGGTHADALDLRLAVEALGPGDDPMEAAHRDPAVLARAFGVPPAVSERWLKQAGKWRRDGNEQSRAPQLTVVIEMLSDGAWHDRDDVLAASAAAVPDRRAAEKAEARRCSEERARLWFARAVVAAAKKRGAVIERNVDGRRYLRWVQRRQPDGRAAARRRQTLAAVAG